MPRLSDQVIYLPKSPKYKIQFIWRRFFSFYFFSFTNGAWIGNEATHMCGHLISRREKSNRNGFWPVLRFYCSHEYMYIVHILDTSATSRLALSRREDDTTNLPVISNCRDLLYISICMQTHTTRSAADKKKFRHVFAAFLRFRRFFFAYFLCLSFD